MYKHTYTGSVIISKEKCPLLNYNIYLKNINHNGGTLFIEDHKIQIQIPENAIANGDIVQIQAAASYFGSYEIPDDYEPISAYLWMTAEYKFKEQVKIVIPHHGAVYSEDDKTAITIMTASEEDGITIKEGKIVFEMHQDNSYDYEVEGAVCVYKVRHFCSDCVVKNKMKNIPNRILALHFVPQSYEFINNSETQSEICFCYDTAYCKNVS